MTARDLSIVIVTWNGCDDLIRCLEAVSAARGSLDLQIIVVDNASQDATVQTLQQRFPEVELIQNAANVGFPRANNQGLARALGRHVLLLNPDTEVGPRSLQSCVAALDADPAVGAVGCRLLYPDGTPQYECARRAYRLRHLIWEAFYLQVAFPKSAIFAHQLMGNWDHTGERDVEALSGAFLMVRRHVVEQVGGVPEHIFMYHEDLSLCLKIQRLGLRIRFLGGVSTVHHHGRSSGRSPLDLHLLEGPVRVALIRERSGVVAGLTARLLFAARSKLRWAIALVLGMIPRRVSPLARLRRDRPKVFDRSLHADQFLWAVLPGLVQDRMPCPPAAALRGNDDTATDV
jgi:GT2 family glycosyltransferase